MSEKKNYPEEIYKDFPTCGSEQGNIAAHMAGRQHAYDLGYEHGKQAQGDPQAGWSNLTEAIKAGENIDWERLNGLEAKCVHPELGTLAIRLQLEEDLDGNLPHPVDSPQAWHEEGSELEAVIESAWLSNDGWSLWVKGDLPLRKRTADGLVPGTCFRARYTKGDYVHTYSRAQAAQIDGKVRVLCFNESMMHVIARYNPAEVGVIEIYGVGTFEKPEGDA